MTVAQIRTIIADRPQHAGLAIPTDGTTLVYRVDYWPIVSIDLDPDLDPTPTVDLDTGTITFTTAPADESTISGTYTHALLSDDDIETFLLLQADDVRLASAMALDTIASNEALVQKKIKLLDITTDGPAVAKSLREHAAQLREEADDDDDFDIAEMVTTSSAWEERIFAQAQRGLLD